MIPTSLRVLLSRTLDLVLRCRRDERLSQEIQAHLDQLVDQFVADGMSRADARLAALRAFGGIDQVKAAYRDQQGLPLVDALIQDVRFAVRLLVRDPGFTVTTVLALALGIGAATTVFTIVNGMNLRSLPVDEPGQIMHMQTENVQSRRQAGMSYADFSDWQQATRTFSGLAAYSGATINIGDEQRPADRLGGTFISANGFSVLRKRPFLGRDFREEDDRPGVTPVVILAHGVWVDRYGRDAAIVGTTIRVNSVPTTVIGVMPEGFRFPILSDLWQPLTLLPGLSRERREARTLGVFGRLADGVTLAQARAELSTIATALAARYPETNQNVTAAVVAFTVQYAGRLTDLPPMLMMTAVTFVLLIACANAANLLLARSVYRAREIALRAAMGASRRRLVRQLLVESVVLAAVASVVGLVLSLAGVRLFTAETIDFGLPYWMDFSVDAPVFVFLVAVCLLTAVIFGLAPAWQLAKTSTYDVLKEGGRGVTGGVRTRRWTGALLVGELALTLVLLAGAGLLLRSAAVLYDADMILDTPNLLTARLSLPFDRFSTSDARLRFSERLQERLDVVSSIASATIGSTMPFSGASSRLLIIDSEPAPTRPRTVQSVAVGDRYFETLGAPIIRGRRFTGADGLPGQEAVIVNERFVARYFPDEDPIGRRIRLRETGADGTMTPWLLIVGVSPSIRQSPAGDAAPVAYVPLRSQPPSNLALVVRGRGDTTGLAIVLRQEVHAIDPDVALYSIEPLERVSQKSRWIPRAMSTVLTLVAGIGLLLVAMGLYAVTAYGVAQRTSEIGIRMALGSQRSQVLWLFLKGALVRLGLGVTIGIAGAIAVGQVLRSLLARTSPLDPLTFVVVVLILASVGVVATLAPALQATRMDPVIALRNE